MNAFLKDLVQNPTSNTVFDLSLELAEGRTIFRSSCVSVYGIMEWFGIDEEGPMGSFNLNLVLNRIEKNFYFLIGVGDGYSLFKDTECLTDMEADPVQWLEGIAEAAKQHPHKYDGPDDFFYVSVTSDAEDFNKLIKRVKTLKKHLSMTPEELADTQAKHDEKYSPF